MIRYHGGPIWPKSAMRDLWTARHGMCSFAHPEQTPDMAELCQSFCLDNGAFTAWKRSGERVDVGAYAEWVRGWQHHPGFDFAIVPDVIDGTEDDNNKMVAAWFGTHGMRCRAAVVWHLHESFERLRDLITYARSGVYDRVCLGSSGQWATIGTDDWWQRMESVREIACDESGRPLCRLHGLRMMNPTIFAHVPFASVDSCQVALNIGKDVKWPAGPYQPVTPSTRALILAERVEHHACAVTWSRRVGIQQNLELIG